MAPIPNDRLERLFLWSSYPSALLLVGYGLFYSQLGLGWWSPTGVAAGVLTALTGVLLAGGFAAAVFVFKELVGGLLKEARGRSWETWLPLATLAVMVSIGLFSALKPAHLIQESDFANYHLTLPKQSWLWASWAPAEWHLLSFISLLTQFGYSAFWVGLPLLNKLPQFLIVLFLFARIWLFFVAAGVKRPYFSGVLAVVALLAFRGVAIQLGSAMLDLPTLYFLAGPAVAAAWFLSEQRPCPRHPRGIGLLLGIDLVAYVGHKSFGFIFFMAIAVVAELLLRRIFKRSLLKAARRALPARALLWLLLPFAGILLPNLIRTTYYTGDPFFPLFPSLTKLACDSSHLRRIDCGEIERMGGALRAFVTHYGYGHGVAEFFKAFFVLPVAWDGPTPVNNKFDYPLGLFWFAAWMAVAAAAVRRGRLRAPALLVGGLCAMLYCLWFAGSHQSRWLYPAVLVLALFWPLGVAQLAETGGRRRKLANVLVALTALAALANGARVVRGQRHTLGCFGASCLASNSVYRADYEHRCTAKAEVLPDAVDHGYFLCRIDWVKRPE